MRTTGQINDGREDFDFFHGRWTVRHRLLKARLAGCADWIVFDGTTVTQPILSGLGNMDDNWLDRPGAPYAAATLRKFDPQARLWSIWWFDARHAGIEPPVLGRFENGVGTFFCEDVFEDRPIKVRFLWSAITPTTCEWRQAFSEDEGATWETNWEMRFTRAG